MEEPHSTFVFFNVNEGSLGVAEAKIGEQTAIDLQAARYLWFITIKKYHRIG